MSITAAISALRHDSQVWDQVAGVDRRAAQEAGALALAETALSWASVETGLLATYTQIQEKTVMLLDEAAQVHSDLSTALDKVASAYELSDDDAARKLKGVWDVHQ